ncbi:MAG: hypothetical protein BGO36_14325 [Burkholderiales bacterium 68-10]|nr:MAG: hypothetical protein BGO36_14325 [Burkholderiales bacterium 68-10]OJX20350.1 MAG: hypothetical protein BGO83_04995 [Devosia sp. 66-14]
MAHYYFNVRRDENVFVDQVGVALSSLEEAWMWALDDAAQLLREGEIDITRHRCWIEVCDEHRCVVISVPVDRTAVQ